MHCLDVDGQDINSTQGVFSRERGHTDISQQILRE